MIIGTAGHIDHGKSTLVSALTGRAMDRLAEERRREITIDLNFAPLDLGGGRVAGVVDVPGHEDFVRTMVAGASGVDLALLVVAADEGMMPQTEEHLAILEQLEVRAGIPVITKSDLVDPEWLELVSVELTERLASSRVPFEAPIAVSARTGMGMAVLHQRLTAIAASLRPRSSADGFRMPIDRVFSVAGVGTVVTGTAWSGNLSVGEQVLVLPSGQEGRVRSLETFGHGVERSESGARTAVGLTGVDRTGLARGEVLVTPDLPWTPTSAVDVEIQLQPDAPRPLTLRTRVRLLIGTGEVMGRVLPRGTIAPGATGLARLSLEEPIVARAEDRFVLRSFSPVGTMGGGRVLDPLPPRRRSVWPSELSAREPERRVRAILERRPAGVAASFLPILLGLPPTAAQAVARAEFTARNLNHHWVLRSSVDQTATKALTHLKEYHRHHPSVPGMPLETLRHSLHTPEPLVEAALDDLIQAGRVRQRDAQVALSGFAPRVAGGDAELERVVAILREAHLSPPSIAELERSLGKRDLLSLLRLAADRGRVEAVERDRYYAREALDDFTVIIEELGRQGTIVPAQVRDRLGISRKFLIPLLEWADGRGITVRAGEGRYLRHSPNVQA
jgi:selenocysteine-specific elongation factor